jgi:hypothetical protein
LFKVLIFQVMSKISTAVIIFVEIYVAYIEQFQHESKVNSISD